MLLWNAYLVLWILGLDLDLICPINVHQGVWIMQCVYIHMILENQNFVRTMFGFKWWTWKVKMGYVHLLKLKCCLLNDWPISLHVLMEIFFFVLMENCRMKPVSSRTNWMSCSLFFFFTHLGYSFNFNVVYLCQLKGGIP